MRKFGLVMAALAAAGTASTAAFGTLYSEDFNVDNSANWTVNDSGLSDILVDFSYDYAAIGVPSANGADTLGLKMTANNTGGVFSGFSVSPTGESFGNNYKVEFDLWQNYVGPVGPGGSGTTQLSMFGLGTAGNIAMWPGAATKESVTFGVTLDGGSASDYRAYSSIAPTSYPSGNPVYAAPSTNGSDAYYTTPFPGGQAAPAAQVGLYPGQTGVTEPGEVGFAWRHVEIEILNQIATWRIDGVLIATVDASAAVLGGSNILFGHSDTNGTSSTDVNDTSLNVTLIDNVVVTPEPASLALLGLGGLAIFRRR